MDTRLRLVYYLWVPNDGFNWVMDIHWKCLEYYHSIFDDALFIISSDSGNDENVIFAVNKVKSLGYKNLQIRFVENKVERESFYVKEEIFDKLGEYDGLTFFAHSKSLSSSYYNWPAEEVLTWIIGMYFFNLNYIANVKNLLINENYFSYGFYFIEGDWITSRYSWIYSGTFYWLNEKKIKDYIVENNIELPSLYNWKTVDYDDDVFYGRIYSENILSSIYPKEYAAGTNINGTQYPCPAEECSFSNLKKVLFEDDYNEFFKFYESNFSNIMSKKNKICVYAICKNESQFVEKWYNSMKEADCIVVLDTGSTDDTVEKLRNLGITVEQKIINPWRFDVARNEAMKLVPSDCNIFVSTDLDEYFDAGWGDILRNKWVEGKHVICDYTYYLADGKKILYNKIHSRGWHWKYPVHELMIRDNGVEGYPLPEETLSLGDEIVLHHEPDRTKSRSSYFDLLELRAKEDPKDYYGLYYLVNEYANIDVKKAIETAKRGIQVSDNEFYKAAFNARIGLLYEQIGDKKKALVYFINALNKCKEYRFIFLHAAKILFDEYQDYNGAYNLLIDGLKYSFFHDFWFEETYGWGSEYYDLLTMSAFYSGRKVDSLIYALIASSKNNDDQRLKDNIQLILNKLTDKEITEYEE